MRRPSLSGDRGIIGDDLDATVARLLERGHERVRIVGRHRDGIDALRDERIQHFDLPFGRRRRGAREDDFGVELLGGFVGALVHGIEEAVAQRLGDQTDARPLRFRRLIFVLAAASQARGQYGARGRYDEIFHSIVLYATRSSSSRLPAAPWPR
jgi:hypothetical protein